ncbi:hypothetical protein BCR34DRAFT_641763 [Clohesyomyces aquaticus]|uniref:Uncharacterized protein n=1 Tax=Clohesyomyces aquaticus TaxID=1231657 RepID=A0A1Y1ZZL6_9PLEO|nr:hypothetical protein BCR34DRAFT_641763 [Clohesyomyces aquaticus]
MAPIEGANQCLLTLSSPVHAGGTRHGNRVRGSIAKTILRALQHWLLSKESQPIVQSYTANAVYLRVKLAEGAKLPSTAIKDTSDVEKTTLPAMPSPGANQYKMAWIGRIWASTPRSREEIARHILSLAPTANGFVLEEIEYWFRYQPEFIWAREANSRSIMQQEPYLQFSLQE